MNKLIGAAESGMDSALSAAQSVINRLAKGVRSVVVDKLGGISGRVCPPLPPCLSLVGDSKVRVCGGEPRRPQHQPAQPQRTNRWAPLTRKRRQQEHGPQRPSENSDPTPQAKRRTGDCPGPRDETATQQACPRKRSEARAGRPECGGEWASKAGKRPLHQPPHPRSANYWSPLTRKRNQQEHEPQGPSEHSDPTQHAKGRTGDCPGPRNETATRRNVTQGGRVCGGVSSVPPSPL